MRNAGLVTRTLCHPGERRTIDGVGPRGAPSTITSHQGRAASTSLPSADCGLGRGAAAGITICGGGGGGSGGGGAGVANVAGSTRTSGGGGAGGRARGRHERAAVVVRRHAAIASAYHN